MSEIDKASLLYYPSFLPPSIEWVKKTLLYWDEICAIVPKEYHSRVLDNTDYHAIMLFARPRNVNAQELVDLGVYRPIDPRGSLNLRWQCGDEIAHKLEQRLESPSIKRALINLPSDDVYYLALGKLTYKAGELLKKPLTLGTNESEWFPNDEWLPVKKPAALLYMSLLAEYVAESEHLQPGTDDETFVESFLGDELGGPILPSIEIVLEHVLPRVSNNVSLAEILSFKQKHAHELSAFRREMSSLQRRLLTIQTALDTVDAIREFEQNVSRELQQLIRILETERLKHTVGTVSAVLTVATPGIMSALYSYGIGTPVDPSTVAISTSLGLIAGGCIKVAERQVAAREARDRMNAQPYSYLYKAHRFDISNSFHISGKVQGNIMLPPKRKLYD